MTFNDCNDVDVDVDHVSVDSDIHLNIKRRKKKRKSLSDSRKIDLLNDGKLRYLDLSSVEQLKCKLCAVVLAIILLGL